jgi:hypothetical protein
MYPGHPEPHSSHIYDYCKVHNNRFRMCVVHSQAPAQWQLLQLQQVIMLHTHAVLQASEPDTSPHGCHNPPANLFCLCTTHMSRVVLVAGVAGVAGVLAVLHLRSQTQAGEFYSKGS